MGVLKGIGVKVPRPLLVLETVQEMRCGGGAVSGRVGLQGKGVIEENGVCEGKGVGEGAEPGRGAARPLVSLGAAPSPPAPERPARWAAPPPRTALPRPARRLTRRGPDCPIGQGMGVDERAGEAPVGP